MLLLSRLRSLVLIRAHCEKKRLLVVDEASIPKYFLAIRDKIGNLALLAFQYSKGRIYSQISTHTQKNHNKGTSSF